MKNTDTLAYRHDFVCTPPLRRTALALLISSCFGTAYANPTLPQVLSGQASFNQQGNVFSITNTPNTIINWQSFSINPGELTRFIQQNANSAVLNRITGQDPSQILGALQSNGKVFLINPNGVLFGHDARVDVNGLVASSLGMSNQDFLAGKMNFNGASSAGAVSNQGAIHAGTGGKVLLIAPNVANSGVITAPNGEVTLAAGHSVQLADAANPGLQVVVSAPSDQALNVGQVIAQGGKIGMYGALINQRGSLNANSAVIGENGKIILQASGKTLLEAGSVTSATNSAGTGGQVSVLGDQVGLTGDARIDASGAKGGGTVLLGGDYQGRNAAVPNARQVYLGSDAVVAADAIDSGSGGKVIVWADQTARVFGSISARGGAASGDGGFVETSGHFLALDGVRVDTRSSRGKQGNWLLDPYDIEVVAGSGGAPADVDQFGDAPNSGVTSIGASLISNATSNVTLQALHRITFSSAINMTQPGIGLTAQAGEAINVNAAIATNGGAVTLSANDASSGSPKTATSNVNLNAGITSNGGAVTISGANVVGAGNISVGSGNLALAANEAGGGITLNGSGDQLSGSGSTGQTVSLQADTISFTGGINFGGANSSATVSLSQWTNGRPIILGTTAANALYLLNDQLNRIAAGTVNIGNSSSGNISLSQAINLAQTTTGTGVRNLNLESGGDIAVSNQLSMLQPNSYLRLKTGVGGTLTVDSSGKLAATNVVLQADKMSLGGSAASLSGEQVTLERRSSGEIDIGSGAVDSATSLGLSDTELKTIAAGHIAVGSHGFNGPLNLLGSLDLSGLSTLNLLELRSSGALNLGGPLTVAKDLMVAGNINPSGAVYVGGVFTLDGGAWQQNNASLPTFYAHDFNLQNGSFLRALGGDGSSATPYRIADIYGLQGINTLSMTNNYVLAGNIDASGTASWNQGNGFVSIANGNVPGYAGVFDGAGHAISGLTVNTSNLPGTSGVGLFARVQGGTLRNMALQGGSVTGRYNVGSLVGLNDGGILDNVFSSAAVTGSNAVGGLVGANGGIIKNSGASGNVTGLNLGGGASVGGLAGTNFGSGNITVSTASGAVNGAREFVGGLVGSNQATITQSYASGSVGGSRSVGGLVGSNSGSISDAYATGAVGMASGADMTLVHENLGGLAGMNSGTISNVFSSGAVNGSGFTAATGGVVGLNAGGTLSAAYWNMDSSGQQTDNGGASGLSADHMLQQSSFNGFNFSNAAVWRIYGGHTTPMLKAFLKPLDVTVSGGTSSKVYDGQFAVFNGTFVYTGLLDGDTSANGTLGYQSARNVGSYALDGLWSTKYDITIQGSNLLSITPRLLGVSVGGSKVYDGTTAFGGATYTVSNVVAGDNVQASGNAQFLDKNAGSGKTVNASGVSLSGNDAGNYMLASGAASGSADISRASLSLGNVSGVNKVYDGNSNAAVNAALAGVLGSDQVSLSGLLASFSDKNAAHGKTINYSGSGALSGADGANYVLAAYSGSTTADISARTLNVSFSGINKTYDGTLSAGVNISDDRVAGDALTLSGNAAFGDKNAGTNKTVSVSGVGVTGADASNYVLNTHGGSTTADIAARTLNVSFSGINKTYDGTTSAGVNIGDDRVAGDALNLSGNASFADKNAGTGKTVSVSNVGVSGVDAGNYVLNTHGGSTTADIAARTLNISLSGINKTYDGTVSAGVNIGDDRVAGDALTLSGNASFTDKNAGTGKTVSVSNVGASGADAGNYVLNTHGGSTTADIAARTLNISLNGINKTYDGTTSAGVNIGDDRVAGDVLNLSGNASFADKNAGTGKTVSVSGVGVTGADAGNYVLSKNSGSTTADIAARTLNVSFSGINKTYDGQTSAGVNISDDRVAGDVLSVSGNASFADKNAGTGKTVSVSNVGVSGADAGNYVLNTHGGSTTADIAARTLNVSFNGINKTYDGQTSAGVNISDDRIAGDALNLSGNAAFGDKNAGTGKTVSVSNVGVSGADAGNYVLNTRGGSTTADIAARTLNVSFNGINKTYDGTVSAGVNITDDRVAGDTLNLSGNAAFGDKNAGTGKTVSVSNVGVTGADAGNYVLNTHGGSTTADIAARTLNVSFNGINKTYDGQTNAGINIGDDRVAGDVLTLSGNAAFGDKNAGTGKAVSVSGVGVTGADAGNYVLNTRGGSTTADIAARTLNVSFSGINKTYDGTVSAGVNITDDRVAGDALNLSGNASFADKNAGTSKTVSVSNVGVSGTDAGNYVLNTHGGSTTADIAARTLNVSFNGINKTYDGQTNAGINISDDRVAGDVLTLSGNAAFGDKNAGTGKTVSVSNVGVSGADAGNYVLNTHGGSTTADIAARTLNISLSGINKTYDGTVSAGVNITDDRVAGDALNLSGNASFADKNAGTGKTVSVSSVGVSGADAGNYVLNTHGGSTTADIAARTLNVSFNGINKTYDGQTNAGVNISDNRVAGDVLNLSGNASFTDKNAGTGKTVSVSSVGVSGADAGNYVLNTHGGSTTADIAARTLNVSFNGINKTYDGQTNAGVNISDDRVAGDALNLSGNASFADKNAGIGKTVSVSNVGVTGADAGNYVLSKNGGSTTADIAARTLNVSFNGINKTYDGQTNAGINISDDRVAGDALNLSGNAAFGDKNAGTGKTVSVSNVGVTGADAGNYVLNKNSGSTTADIAARTLNVSFSGINKTYDSHTNAGINISDDRVAGDALSLSGNASFADKNAGTGKTVSVSNVGVTGADAGNYVLNTHGGSTTADIAARTLNVSFSGINKTYDGHTNAGINISDDRIAGDALNLSGNAAFGDKNAGTNKTVSVSGVGLTGADAGNYVLNTHGGSTTADIAARTLNVSFNGINKTYDGQTNAGVNISDDRIAGDALNLAGNAAFADKNAGTGKTVSVSNVGVTGADAGNYVLNTHSGSTTADIAARALNLSAVGVNKVYDGGTAASVILGDNRIAGDVLGVTAAASFADKNAGAGKAVTLSGVALSGQDAGNYFVVLPTGLLASITPAALNLTGLIAGNKVYDGTSNASVSASLSGVLGQDVVSVLGGSGSFVDKNAGTDKLVTASGFRLAGIDAANYVLNTTGGTARATISQKLLSTWIGSGNGLWSDAANWDGGVVPEGANVVAVDFSHSNGVITYNAAAGSTTLKNMNSGTGLLVTGGSLTLGESAQDRSVLGGSAGLEITGGNLFLNGSLSADRYAQSGGLLGGSGNLAIGNSFSQAAGAIKLGGQLAINQASGDLRFASLAASDVRLSALNGAIGQTGALVTTKLATQSANGTVLDNAGNQVGNFTANNSGAGGIVLNNTSAPGTLTLGDISSGAGNIAIDNTGGIAAGNINSNGGNVTLTAHSPITLNGVVTGNDISVSASTDLALADGARLAAARNISLTAGRDLGFNGAAKVASGGNVVASAGANVRFADTASFTVPAAASMSVLAKTGNITGTSGVRINRQRTDVSLLAPGGKVSMSDAIFVLAIAPPAITPGVNTAINDALNIIKQADRANDTLAPPVNTTTSPDKKKDDVKQVATADQSTGNKFNDGTQKMYCN